MESLAGERAGELVDLAGREHLQLVLTAVAAGNTPGEIWVDDAGAQRSALLWDRGHSLYLLGDAVNARFVDAAAQWIAGELLPQGAARGLGIFKLYRSDDAWETHYDRLFPGLALRRLERSLFVLTPDAHLPPAPELPAGLSLCAIDAALLAEAGLAHRDDLTGEIASCWPSVERFVAQGFGVCALEGTAIAGWCTAETVSATRCGAGIETVEAYQQRGIGALLAAVWARRCQERGLVAYWDSWTDNAPSVRVALKSGFRAAYAYTVDIGRFPNS
ncbi:MAG: GNAT family N-acetyltransferase [Caldilinea sp.]|nr:GNAT family N-acetyltransferase [Caldilinea sp.]